MGSIDVIVSERNLLRLLLNSPLVNKQDMTFKISRFRAFDFIIHKFKISK